MKKYYFNVEERYDIDLDDLGSQESLIFVSNGELRLRNIVKERWLMHERMNNEVSEDKLALLYVKVYNFQIIASIYLMGIME